MLYFIYSLSPNAQRRHDQTSNIKYKEYHSNGKPAQDQVPHYRYLKDDQWIATMSAASGKSFHILGCHQGSECRF